MKKLTKVLSLVLVIAMVISLCVVGVSANNYEPYTDADTVGEAYKEATDVMIGAGIVAGMNATTLAPTGNYTRAQAAKIVAYMRLGAQAADALSCNAAPFSDVPTSYWAAGFISYCKSMGIIDGYGNGKFGPEDTLTGYQWGKMCLTVLGYGANKEYNKVDWTISVAKDAIPLGIYDGDMTAACSTPIQRQQAILMAFNTFTKGLTVSYSALLGTYTTSQTLNGTVTGVTLAESMYNIFNTTSLVGDDIVAATAKINGIKTDATVEEIGHTAHTWYQVQGKKNVQIANVYLDDTVLGTSVDGTAIGTLASKTSSKYIASLDAEVTYWVDGKAATTTPTNTAVAAGDKVTFIDTDANEKADVVFVQHEDSAVVTAAAYTTNTGTAGETTTLPGSTVKNLPTDEVVMEKAFTKGDVVTVQTKRDGNTYVNAAASVEGTLDAITMTVAINDTFTVGENSLLKGKDFSNTGMNAYTKAGDVTKDELTYKGTFYKGTEGYCVGVKFDTTPMYNLALVIDTSYTLGGGQARLLLPDGTTPVVNVAKLYDADGKTVIPLTEAVDTNRIAEIFNGTIVGYSAADAGYTLTLKYNDNYAVKDGDTGTTYNEEYGYNYTTGDTTLTGVEGQTYDKYVTTTATEEVSEPVKTAAPVGEKAIVDSKTIAFTYFDGQAVPYKAFVGASNIPNLNDDVPYLVMADDGITVLAMFFNEGFNTETTTTYYGAVASVTASYDNGTKHTTLVFNSANTTVPETLTVEGGEPVVGGFYSYVKSTDGTKVLMTNIPYTEFKPLSFASVNGEYINFNGDVLKLADGCKGYYMSTSGVAVKDVQETTFGATSANPTLAYVVKDIKTGEVTEVWYAPLTVVTVAPATFDKNATVNGLSITKVEAAPIAAVPALGDKPTVSYKVTVAGTAEAGKTTALVMTVPDGCNAPIVSKVVSAAGDTVFQITGVSNDVGAANFALADTTVPAV